MEFAKLKSHLSLKQYSPAYLVYGDDAFVVKSASDRLRSIAELPDFNLSLFNESHSAVDIVNACMQLPVMSDYRVVEVEGYKRDMEQFANYLKKPSPSTVLVFKYNGAIPASVSKWVKSFNEVNCNKLVQSFITEWIAKECVRQNSSITAGAAALLIKLCNSDMTRISSELNKLCSATGDIIKEELVSELVTADNEFKIYELSEALCMMNTQKTYDIYATLITSMPPVTILGALYGHFRRLLYISVTKDQTRLSEYLGVKEYAINMASRQAKEYKPIRLKQITDRLNYYDRAFKSGKIGDREALDTFIAETLVQGRNYVKYN